MTAAIRMTGGGPVHLADWCAPLRWRGLCRFVGEGEVRDDAEDGLRLDMEDGTTREVVKLWLYAEEVPDLGRFCTVCTERLRFLLNDRMLLLGAVDAARVAARGPK